MFHKIQKIIGFFLPGSIVLAVAFFCYRQGYIDPWLPYIDLYGSYLVLGFGFLLGWRFHRSRLAFIILLLMLADRMLYYFGPGGVDTTHGKIVYHVVAILLPINMSLFYFVKERGMFNPQGLLRIIFIFMQPLVVYYLLSEKSQVFRHLAEPMVNMPLLDKTGIPQTVLLAYLGTLLVFLICALISPKPIIRGYFWALLSVGVGLDTAGYGSGTTVYFSAAGLIIILAVIETAYVMAYNDELTGLPARRSLNTTLQGLGRRYAIAMLDIDFFKKFNDKYGHDVGDQVLCMVASHIGRVVGGGKPFRYGGEEFTVVFPGKEKNDVLPHLENLRQSIADAQFALRGKNRPKKAPKRKNSKNNTQKVSVTISIGVAEPDSNHLKPAEVIKAADKALYRAKKKGRNCVAT